MVGVSRNGFTLRCQFYRAMRIFFILLFISLLSAFCAEAQNTSWFYGSWAGETYFPNGPITKRIIVRLQVTKVSGNNFTATMDNLFPSDTIVRLQRDITGTLAGKNFTVTSSEETYIRDLRTQNFWYNCTACPANSSFAITGDKVEIRLSTYNCGDVCNGETVFRRDTSDLSADQKIQLARWLNPSSAPPIAKNKKKKTDSTIASVQPQAIAQKKDSIASPTKPARQVSAPTVQPIKKDTVRVVSAINKLSPKDTMKPVITVKKDTTEGALQTRNTNLVQTYHVTSPHITIQLYDNAEIDGDVVSVFHNGKLIVTHQSLTHKAISFTIDATPAEPHHEFVLVAENLGLIPPNTALMRITAGQQKFEVEISSDFDNNAKIAIDYTGE